MFPNIQDQFLHAMESDAIDPRAMERDVRLPEDETKCNRIIYIYTHIYTYIYLYMYIYMHLYIYL